MSTPDTDGWQRTSPFAILFFVGRILRLIAKNAWQSFAPLFALLVAYQGDLVSKLVLGGVGAVTLIGVASLLSYWFFRYQLGDDSILIRQGVIKKTQLDIKFDRIQAVNTRQNIVYRYLNLVTVVFDTAGSSGDEGKLPAVSLDFADSLRRRIAKRSEAVDAPAADDAAGPAPLLTLDWRDMIRIGLSDRRALLIFALIGPLMERLGEEADDAISRYLQQLSDKAIEFGVVSGASVASIVIIIVLALFLLFALVSISAAFLRYHQFQLYVDGTTLRSRGGLLTRHEHSMDVAKIQTLRLQQGIVLGWMRRFKLTARQAVSGGKNRGDKVFTIPVVTVAFADSLRQRLLQPEAGRLSQDPRSGEFRRVSPHYMRSRLLYGGLLPALGLAAMLVPGAGSGGLLALLWLPLAGLFTWQSWRRSGYLHDDEELIRRSGLVGFRTSALLFRKVQRVTVRQSRYQRRRGLASLRLYMASGSITVPYIDHAEARRLRDYVLYKVESSQQAWH